MRPAQTEVIASALNAVVWDMCASLIRTAFSPNVKERADCSTALCSPDGAVLALATHAPAHMGSTIKLVAAIKQRFPVDTLKPGDVFLANDPYLVGVTHLNDCTVAAPVFVAGQIVAFVAAVAHHSDVGGKVPGSESGDSRSIFQEGIRIPPVKIIEAGNLRRDVLELFLLNSRTPHFGEGDFYAQTSAVNGGIDGVRQLYARYGSETVETSIRAVLDATERRSRASIRSALTPGVYAAEDFLDDDGDSGEPIKLTVRVEVDADSIHVDLSGCGPQVKSGKNVPFTHTAATVYYAFKLFVDAGVPINDGLYRVIRITTSEGTVVNPSPPAGVGSRNLTSMILADVIIDALSQAAPLRAIAPSGPYQGIVLSGIDPRRNRFYVDYENFAGGHGASATANGMDGMQVHMTNTSNLPIEVMELEFPIRVERYELQPGTGGAGRFRGGDGVVRELRVLAPQAAVAFRSARQRFAAQGRHGGGAGALGRFELERDGQTTALPGTCSEFHLRQDDLLRIVTPGGGGMGAA